MAGGKNLREWANWLPALIALGFIMLGSTDYLSGHEIAVRIDIQVERVTGVNDWVYPLLKKLSHVGTFFGAALTLFPLRRRRQGLRLAVVLLAAISLFSEIVQAISLTRLPAVSDVAVNLCASLSGCYLLFNPPPFVLAGWERLRQWRPSYRTAHAGTSYPPLLRPQTRAALFSVSKQPRRATEARS